MARTVRTSREYETIFIIRPDANEEERTRVTDRVAQVMERLEGTLIKHEEWGKRRLAYPIQKHGQGIYHYYQFLGFNDLVPEIERNLRMLEPVLKYMTVKLDDDVDREARLSEDSDEGAEASDEQVAEESVAQV